MATSADMDSPAYLSPCLLVMPDTSAGAPCNAPFDATVGQSFNRLRWWRRRRLALSYLEDGAEHHVLQALGGARVRELVVRLEGLQEVGVRRLVVPCSWIRACIACIAW